MKINNKVKKMWMNGKIKRRKRIIGKDKRGKGNKREWNGNEMKMEEGKIMRIFLRRRIWKEEGIKKLGKEVVEIEGDSEEIKRKNRIGNDKIEGMERIEREIRIMKNRMKEIERLEKEWKIKRINIMKIDENMKGLRELKKNEGKRKSGFERKDLKKDEKDMKRIDLKDKKVEKKKGRWI